MNNRPFNENYLEVTIPLDSVGMEIIENAPNGEANLYDYHNNVNHPMYAGVYCELIVTFDFTQLSTEFHINTVCTYPNEPADMEMSFAEFDNETADYFKAEALKHLARNINAIRACTPVTAAVTA